MKTPKPRLTAAQKRTATFNRLIRAAALTLHPKGRIDTLAERVGVTGEAIRYCVRKGRFSAKMARRIEQAVGKAVLPKEKLLPRK